MKSRHINEPPGRMVVLLLFLSMVLFCVQGCRKSETKELYHKFPDRTWARFNILSFEIPVEKTEKPFNVYLFVRFSKEFQYEYLEFNMNMITSAGEERTHVYKLDVRSKAGAFLGACKDDSCQGTILLKRELRLSKPGILKIEIENLTPRLITEGVLGAGIRMEQSGK
jgi:gliding motility-associated lipoprotein GldH